MTPLLTPTPQEIDNLRWLLQFRYRQVRHLNAVFAAREKAMDTKRQANPSEGDVRVARNFAELAQLVRDGPADLRESERDRQRYLNEVARGK